MLTDQMRKAVVDEAYGEKYPIWLDQEIIDWITESDVIWESEHDVMRHCWGMERVVQIGEMFIEFYWESSTQDEFEFEFDPSTLKQVFRKTKKVEVVYYDSIN